MGWNGVIKIRDSRNLERNLRKKQNFKLSWFIWSQFFTNKRRFWCNYIESWKFLGKDLKINGEI